MSRRRRRGGTILFLVAALIGLPFILARQVEPAAGAPIVAFAPRFTTTDNGTVAIFGNNLLSCPTSDSSLCRRAGGNAELNNNSFTGANGMTNRDVDGVAGTFNSSSSIVTSPPGADVLWAGLYWGARRVRARAVLRARGTGARCRSARPAPARIKPSTPRPRSARRPATRRTKSSPTSRTSYGPRDRERIGGRTSWPEPARTGTPAGHSSSCTARPTCRCATSRCSTGSPMSARAIRSRSRSRDSSPAAHRPGRDATRHGRLRG